MRPGISHSGHRSPGRRTAPPLVAARMPLPFPGDSANTGAGCTCSPLQTSAPSHCALCVSSLSLNFQLSTIHSNNSAQRSCFHSLPHSSTTSQKSPLCFHILTNSFSCSSFILTFIQIARGCHPADEQIVEPQLEPRIANSNPANNSSRCLQTSRRLWRVVVYPPRNNPAARRGCRAEARRYMHRQPGGGVVDAGLFRGLHCAAGVRDQITSYEGEVP